ncbi:MAG: DUF4932 domain-containing protein [Planctomycetes bacterium]|nr:DUF4932 domain-containing protein [Planctomycetota bacterium]
MLTSVIVSSIAWIQPVEPAAASITVRCDARVELFCIVARLAGDPEFNDDRAESPYADAVEDWFDAFRTHPAVEYARVLRRDHGITFDAVPDLALHCDDVESLLPRMPLTPRPARLDARWTEDIATEYLDRLRSFVIDTKFVEFFASQADRYRRTELRLAERLADAKIEAWVAGYFGERSVRATFTVIPSLLNGPNNYGCGVQFEDGRFDLSPVMGIWKWDAEGVAEFGPEHVPTVVHEFTHNFANPVIDRHADALEAPGRALFTTVQKTMEMQAYPTWRIMLYESLVRACVNRYVAEHQGADAARADAADNARRGFTWTADFAALLEEYEADRERYPDLDAFAPRIVAWFVEQAAHVKTVEAIAPRVVSMEPANGATDVDPATTVIRVTFDRKMANGFSFVLVGAKSDFPPTAGPPAWDAARRVVTLPVKLEPGRTYRYGLNGGEFQSFQSVEGTPLVPVVVEFTTASR